MVTRRRNPAASRSLLRVPDAAANTAVGRSLLRAPDAAAHTEGALLPRPDTEELIATPFRLRDSLGDIQRTAEHVWDLAASHPRFHAHDCLWCHLLGRRAPRTLARRQDVSMPRLVHAPVHHPSGNDLIKAQHSSRKRALLLHVPHCTEAFQLVHMVPFLERELYFSSVALCVGRTAAELLRNVHAFVADTQAGDMILCVVQTRVRFEEQTACVLLPDDCATLTLRSVLDVFRLAPKDAQLHVVLDCEPCEEFTLGRLGRCESGRLLSCDHWSANGYSFIQTKAVLIAMTSGAPQGALVTAFIAALRQATLRIVLAELLVSLAASLSQKRMSPCISTSATVNLDTHRLFLD